MIMVYDGCKILLVESMDRAKPMTLETLGMFTMQGIVSPVITMEYFNTASVDGSIKSGILKPFSAKPENSHVMMDFGKLPVIWAKEVLEDDLAALKVEEAFLAPIWNKMETLKANYTKEQEDAINEKVASKVKELISQATEMDPAAFKKQVEAIEKDGGLGQPSAPNANHMAVPSSNMMGLPGVSTPMEFGNFNE